MKQSVKMAFKTLFVTCGATVPFPKLVECILAKQFLQELVKNGFKRIIVQFGKDYRDSFAKLVCEEPNRDSTSILNDLGYKGEPVHGRVAAGQLEVIGIEYSTNIQAVIEKHADLVISHAGTGSILDSLRLGKPLIICVNDTLMDNHQQQIADKFESANYLFACFPKVDELIQSLRRLQTEQTVPFPRAFNENFEKAVINLVYGPAALKQ